MIAPWMGGKRKARGVFNDGSTGATNNAAIAAQTKRGPCQQAIEANSMSCGHFWSKAHKNEEGAAIFCDLVNCPG